MKDHTDEVTYFAAIEPDECRRLLRTRAVGRVAWTAPEGLMVMPVNYRLVGEHIVFHTGDGTLLSHLVEPTDVGFQIDDIQDDEAIGWSVLVRGRSGGVEGLETRSWMPDDRSVGIAITPQWLGGRIVSGRPDHH